MSNRIGKTRCSLAGLLFLALCWTSTLPARGQDAPLGHQRYLGQKPPGLKPKVFARGLVSSSGFTEFSSTFSPDYREFYFTRVVGNDVDIYVIRWEEGAWTAAEPAPFNQNALDHEPHITADGSTLYFGSERLQPNGLVDYGIWSVDLESGVLEYFGPGMYATTSRNKNLYLTDISGPHDEIVMFPWVRGRYRNPILLGPGVNSEYGEAHPCVAWDESFLIFDSYDRPDRVAESDLYMSHRLPDGTWAEALHLPTPINTTGMDSIASLSPDGRYVFLNWRLSQDIYWVDARAFGIVNTLVVGHADYDGDGRADPAVYDTETSTWRVDGQPETRFGTDHAVPTPGDYDGDGQADLAYFVPDSGLWKVQGQVQVRGFGSIGDIPVPADYDGDGRTDMALYHPFTGLWRFLESSTSFEDEREEVFGTWGDIPVPADYDGNGAAEIAVFRPLTRTWLFQDAPAVKFGKGIDEPVPADYDGDGAAEMAVWSPKNGKWTIRGGRKTKHGRFGDFPVPGDYDGDGKADIAFYDPESGTWDIRGQDSVTLGEPGDLPLGGATQ